MPAEIAAGYVGEPSVESFHAKVGSIYPQPNRTPGMLPKWHRAKLDRAVAKRHGLMPPALAEDAESLL
jgi:hypothetical protein